MNRNVLLTLATITPLRPLRLYRVGLAGILVMMILSQLFTFELFPREIDELWQTSGMAAAYLVAISLVTCELFALPYLLGMRLSPLLRVASMVSGWIVGLLWILITSWQQGVPGEPGMGIFGVTLVMPKALSLYVAILLTFGIVAAVFPLLDRRKKKA